MIQATPVLKKKILVVLPSPIMARNFLHTDILQLLGAGSRMEITVVSPNPADRALVERHGASWHPYFHPRRSREPGAQTLFAWFARIGRYVRYLAGLLLHMCMTYRINTISEFKGFSARLNQSFALRKVYLREGLPMAKIFGFPFARSIAIYRVLYKLYYMRWQSFDPVEKFVSRVNPDLMVLSMVQTHMVTPYALAARQCGLKVLGINGSWDQPTTKGPVCPGLARIAVQNEIVHSELIRYHHIPDGMISVIGWLQMDAYFGKTEMPRDKLLLQMGIPSSHRYILFAANAPRLGLHEPEVLKLLAMQVQAGKFGENVTLVCRCHPQDRDWKERWSWAAHLLQVVVEPPDLGPLDHLAELIRHAGVVIASAGSINLDAVALDTPTIGLAWEDDSLPYWDRPARAYDLEHLADLRNGSGIMFARNIQELVSSCEKYLTNPELDALAREELRSRYLFRLDGKAANRLAMEIEGMLA